MFYLISLDILRDVTYLQACVIFILNFAATLQEFQLTRNQVPDLISRVCLEREGHFLAARDSHDRLIVFFTSEK